MTLDFVDRMAGRSFNFGALLKFTDLDPRVQNHLKRVYATLACALVVAAIGSVAHLTLHVGGLISFVGGLVSITWLLLTPDTPSTLYRRYSLLGLAAFFDGCSLGPLVERVLLLHPEILLTAFLGTAAAFFCFSGAALVSQRRSFIYLGGVLSSAIVGLFVFRMCDIAFGVSRMVHLGEVYLGLGIFLLYIVFDTQMIVEKAYAGADDHVKAALDLFIDFVAVFVRVMVIMLDNAEKREKKRRN